MALFWEVEREVKIVDGIKEERHLADGAAVTAIQQTIAHGSYRGCGDDGYDDVIVHISLSCCIRSVVLCLTVVPRAKDYRRIHEWFGR